MTSYYDLRSGAGHTAIPTRTTPRRRLLVAGAAIVVTAGVGLAANALTTGADDAGARPGVERDRAQPLIVPEEQAFIDAHLHAPAAVRTTTVQPLIVPEEQAFIDAHLHAPAAVRTTTVQPLIIPEEQAFIDAHLHAPTPVRTTTVGGEDAWCLAHDPC